jgi:hypothetical protein
MPTTCQPAWSLSGNPFSDARPKLEKLLTNPQIGVLLGAQRDRLTRFGSGSMTTLVEQQGRWVEAIAPSDTGDDLVEDLVAGIPSMAARISGRRESKRQAERKKRVYGAGDVERGGSMKVVRGYRTELDLNNAQITLCRRHAGANRWAYNWGLARKQEAYKAAGKSPSAIDLHRELNILKKTDVPWMYEVSKCAPQEALRDLDKAFKHFFRRCELKKQGRLTGKVGYPPPKTKKQGQGHFQLAGSIHVYRDAIQLPRLGRCRVQEHRYLPIGAKGPGCHGLRTCGPLVCPGADA